MELERERDRDRQRGVKSDGESYLKENGKDGLILSVGKAKKARSVKWCLN